MNSYVAGVQHDDHCSSLHLLCLVTWIDSDLGSSYLVLSLITLRRTVLQWASVGGWKPNTSRLPSELQAYLWWDLCLMATLTVILTL